MNTDNAREIAGSTKILSCTCKSAFQDERYGRGNRVHNLGKDESPRYAVCTVCGNERVV